eukprot:scaffold1561_cov129-Cylindrotheca_fusiformis.AAC.22
MAEETVNVNPDGSTTFEGEESTMPPAEDAGGEGTFDEETIKEVAKGGDPAIYLLLVVILLGILYFIYKRKSREDEDDFFDNLDGEKFNLKLPAEVDEYYAIKDKCLDSGWEPGTPPDKTNPSGHHRMLAQALMKRAIGDIPIWRSYQAAEAMVSSEVEEVKAEADLVEPGWSQVIWRQAMQYHNMLKQKHEMEQKAAAEAAAKKKAVEESKTKEQIEEEKIKAAERAAAELIKAEERERDSKKAFSGGVKKGFLDNKKKNKK